MCPILRGEKHRVSDGFVALAEENEETLVEKVEIIDQSVECDQASNGKSTVTSVVSGQPADSKRFCRAIFNQATTSRGSISFARELAGTVVTDGASD